MIYALPSEIEKPESCIKLSYGSALATEPLHPLAPVLMLPTPGSKAQLKKAKTGKTNRRGKKASRPRGGLELREARGDPVLRDAIRLRKKLVLGGDLFRTQSFSILEDAPHASTGWEGLNLRPKASKEILTLYRQPAKMQKTLETFRPIPANL